MTNTQIELGTGRTFDPQWLRVGIDEANLAKLTKQMKLQPAWRGGTITVADANGNRFSVAVPTIAAWRRAGRSSASSGPRSHRRA